VELRILPKRAFISIGSNIEPETNLPLAIRKLKRLGEVVSVSGVYQNPALGRTEQPDFLNAAVLLLSDHRALTLRRELRAIEAKLGRVRTEDKFAARTMDLDLCLYGDLIIQAPDFTVPDPEIHERAHVAVPLADLDPEFKHPITNEPLSAIADRLRSGAELTPREDIEEILRSLLENSSDAD
jgi:2-amino-4-hydroxy-6-hydroxymethyldihydropteridine diphosphokinase